jgi:hypothetical protein
MPSKKLQKNDKVEVRSVEQPRKLTSKKQALIGILIVAVVLIITTLSGFVAIVFKQPSQKIVLVNKVCSEEIIATYNQASLLEQRTGSADYSVDKQTLDKLAADIKSKKNYLEDPTCQAILLSIAVINEDFEAAKSSLALLKELQDKNLYIADTLRFSGALEDYEGIVEGLDPNAANTEG